MTREQGGAQAKPSNTLARSRIINPAEARRLTAQGGDGGILKAYIPKSWFHEKGIYKVLADLVPRLPDVKGKLFITLTVDPKLFLNPEEAYETSRNKIRKVFYALRKGTKWDEKVYKIRSKYCVKTEFHKNGFAHFHIIFLTRRFLPNELLNELWNLGRTQVKRISNEDFHYLLKYVTKAGELPEWVKRKKRLRIFQPSHGFLKPKEVKKYKKKPKIYREKRASYSIGERQSRWRKTVTLITVMSGTTRIDVRSYRLPEPFKKLFDHLVYSVALDGRYLGDGKILIKNKNHLSPWMKKIKPQ